MAILSEKQIAAIKKHRYSVEGTSIMDFLDVLYLWMAKKIHHRVTANLVTIIGLVSVVLSCSFVAYFSYIGDHQSLQSSGYLCAFGLLMWMSCDSIDGKVARLRDLCSPFGEILDHGGDAFALMMSSVALACILGVTDTPLGTVAWILCDMAAYYFSEPYTIYVCGQSRIESFDFYEFLTLYIGICLSHATFGKEIWQYTIFSSIGFRVIHIFYGLKILIPLEIIFGKTKHFYDAAKSNRLSFWHSIAPVIPVFIILTSASIAFVSVSQEVLKENAILFGLCFGFCFAKIHIQLIIAKMSKTTFYLLDTASTFPVVIMCGCVFIETRAVEKNFLIFSTIATGLDAMIYFIRLLHQLYHSLGETLFLLDHNRNQCKKSNGFSK
ncbi:cholinephosphotransferase 1-like [Rhopilema esculentum]|uniref:cholinephosphotransferase 1-like n=1 Tax=Rhopilema esculentum TaxID=499914 RepID=UPI0031CED89C